MKHLIIGSGAMIAFKFLGVLKYLKDHGHLEDVEEISSASSGALIAAFYILFKGDLDRLIKFFISVNIADYTKIHVKNFIKNWGLIDSSNVKKLADEHGFRDITFRELYEIWPVKFHVATFDIINKRTVYMSIDTFPDMDVSTALMYTVSVPFLFTPSEGQYLDGSTIESNPGAPFIGKLDVFEIRTNDSFSHKANPKTLFDYLITVLICFVTNRIKYQDFKRIEVPIDFDIFDFSMSVQKKQELYLSGYQLSVSQIPDLLGNPEIHHLRHYTDVPEQTEDSQCPQPLCDPAS